MNITRFLQGRNIQIVSLAVVVLAGAFFALKQEGILSKPIEGYACPSASNYSNLKPGVITSLCTRLKDKYATETASTAWLKAVQQQFANRSESKKSNNLLVASAMFAYMAEGTKGAIAAKDALVNQEGDALKEIDDIGGKTDESASSVSTDTAVSESSASAVQTETTTLQETSVVAATNLSHSDSSVSVANNSAGQTQVVTAQTNETTTSSPQNNATSNTKNIEKKADTLTIIGPVNKAVLEYSPTELRWKNSNPSLMALGRYGYLLTYTKISGSSGFPVGTVWGSTPVLYSDVRCNADECSMPFSYNYPDTISLTIENLANHVSDTVVFTVDMPFLKISADSTSIPADSSTMIRWSGKNLVSCHALGGPGGDFGNKWAGEKPTSGTFDTGKIPFTLNYGIECIDKNGKAYDDSVLVEVK